jgi:hypothetical protein
VGCRATHQCPLRGRPECKGLGDTLHVWNLRGHNADLTLLRPKLEEQLARHQFGLIILDPAYKVLGTVTRTRTAKSPA